MIKCKNVVLISPITFPSSKNLECVPLCPTLPYTGQAALQQLPLRGYSSLAIIIVDHAYTVTCTGDCGRSCMADESLTYKIIW
jgi:hypothetical protein